jgi:hypothetical protein
VIEKGVIAKMSKVEGRSLKTQQTPTSVPISRVPETAPTLTVDQACEGDFRYFCEHPDEDEYIRQFVPGEFGAGELPDLPAGFRYATHVSVTITIQGVDGDL